MEREKQIVLCARSADRMDLFRLPDGTRAITLISTFHLLADAGISNGLSLNLQIGLDKLYEIA